MLFLRTTVYCFWGLLLSLSVRGQSFNQPRFCPSVFWDPNAITVLHSSNIGVNISGLFVNTNNTLFIPSLTRREIQIWFESATNVSRMIPFNRSSLAGLFVTMNDDIYIHVGQPTGIVERYSLNSSNPTYIMNVSSGVCFGLFITENGSLYCSLPMTVHRVIRTSLANTLVVTAIAGTGTAGNTTTQLRNPYGIFVDRNFGLYVADSGNNRIQFFAPGQPNGTTIAINGSSGVIPLRSPNFITLDGNGFLYILDFANSRLIGSGLNGFRCIAGCTGSNGSAMNQMSSPANFAFDSYGNILVSDMGNSRIQKFLLATNSCEQASTVVSTIESTSLSTAFGTTTAKQMTSISIDTSTMTTTISYSSSLVMTSQEQSDSTYVTSYDKSTAAITSQSQIDTTQTIDYGSSSAVTTSQRASSDFTSVLMTSLVQNGSTEPTSYDSTSRVMTSQSQSDSTQKTSYVSSSVTMATGTTQGVTNQTTTHVLTSFLTTTEFQSDTSLTSGYDTTSTVMTSQSQNESIQTMSDEFSSKSVTISPTQGVTNSTSILMTSQSQSDSTQQTSYESSSISVTTNLIQSVTISETTSHGSTSFVTTTELQSDTSQTTDHDATSLTIQNQTTSSDFITTSMTSHVHTDSTPGINDKTTYAAITSSPQSTTSQTIGQDSTSLATTRVVQMNIIQTTDYNITNIVTTNHVENNTSQTTTLPVMSQSSSTTDESTSATSSSSMQPNCLVPSITLIPPGSSWQSPIQYRRNQDVFFSSEIQLNCHASIIPSTRWILKRCTLACSLMIPMNSMIQVTSSEIFISARTLSVGIYEMTYVSTVYNISSSTTAYFQIIPADVIINLFPFGTSLITHDYQQNLTLNPGLYSYHLDNQPFNASDWTYVYHCRIYDLADFPNILGVRLSIDDPRIDPFNPSCLNNTIGNHSVLQHGGISSASQSSITIFATVLPAHRTYHFMVTMENRQNTSMKVFGDVLIFVESNPKPTVLIGCVISSMCRSNFEFQYVNPTTQVALFSLCQGNGSSLTNMTWSLYQGTNRSSTGIQWIPFNDTARYENRWFFGQSTSNFTSTAHLFINYPLITYWKFQVTYSFVGGFSSSAMNFQINRPPTNGSCSISPMRGTTTTPMTISCPFWFDTDGIKDYSIYVNGIIVGFSIISSFEIRFFTDQENGTFLNPIVHIRDHFDCVTEYNLSSIFIEPDLVIFNEFITNMTNNSLIPLLNSGNQNQVAQVINGLAQQFNRIDRLYTEFLHSNVSISPLIKMNLSSSISNQSVEDRFHRTKNFYSHLREYLIQLTSNLTIASIPSIQLQATVLSHLTQSTNQLTRVTATKATEKCSQLAQALYQRFDEISIEDAKNSAEPILRCFSNIFTAVSGPIQERSIPLDLDFTRANTFPDDYETDLELDWANPNLFADGNDFSWNTIARRRNLYYQNQLAQQIDDRMRETTKLLTETLNIHLNSGQNITMNSSSIVMILGRLPANSLSNQIFEEIRLPSIFDDETPVTYRLIIQPLAAADRIRSNFPTNLSRSLSFSVFDRNLNEKSIRTNRSNPIELLIARDANFRPPNFYLQNVTELNETKRFFNFHFVNLTSDVPMSLHFQLKSTDENVSYLLIFAFDRNPQWNLSIDGSKLFCPSNRSFYEVFVDASQIENHRSIVFGIRELTTIDVCSNSSSLNINEPFRFTSNYFLRSFRSSCFYLDENRQWKSDGLSTKSSENFDEIRCFSSFF